MILISNDLNLVNKSIVSSMQAISFVDLKKNLNQLLVDHKNQLAQSKLDQSEFNVKFFEEPFSRLFYKDLVNSFQLWAFVKISRF